VKKIISLLVVGIFVFSGFVAVAKNSRPNLPYNTTSFDDDVPEWQVGDTWTYTIDSVIVDYDQSGQKISIDGRIDDFTWKVTDASGDYYTLSISGKLTATYDIYLSSQTLTLHLVGSFKPTLTRLVGTIQLTKSSLQVHDLSIQLKGISSAKINSIPFSIPLFFKLITEGELSDDFPLFEFPLYGLKLWNMPDLQLTMSSTFGGLFGLIQIPFTIGVHYSWIPFAFICHDKQDVNVEAGTYSAYKITSLIGDYFEYYYAPSAGNIVKFDVILTNGEAHGELKSTNYS
jgi:hypothetical protein